MSNDPTQIERRLLLKNTLATIERLQAKLDAVEQSKQEPLAIIGMSCRFPGGANSLEAYWSLLQNGLDTIREVPSDRWPNNRSTDSEITWYGSFLDDIDLFDPQFFGISPREAATMDPQQRLVLEVTWEALERGGIAPDSLRNSQTGVFVGVTTNDYAHLNMMRDPAELDAYAATGSALNVVPGRVAYTLGLHGPSIAIDTACSSSLVAIHLACQSLRLRESDMALAGGVNVLLRPEPFICFSRWGMMAPDGRCKAFDARADGFVRGEGCGMIVLKRLSDALSNGDAILALIRGSAVNQDGRSSGLTVPNGLSQRAVIQHALLNAGVKPAEIGYVEAHGTGTALGDPIEVEAIGEALHSGRNQGAQPLFLSSVKTNIGHLESASGVAGLIKVVMALQHQEIPGHLHLQEPNPKIPWPKFPLEIPTAARQWPAINGQRLAGVSAFGFSGTNAHVILAQAPESEERNRSSERPFHLLTLSARNEAALIQLAARFGNHLSTHSEASPADVTFTTNTGRTHFGHRLAAIATGTIALGESLAAFATGQTVPNLVSGNVAAGRQPQVAFLFTGQGAQYVNMGRQLFQTDIVFRRTLERCDEILRPFLDRSLLSIIYPAAETAFDVALIDQTQYTQPALFAIEYALAQVWKSWGVVPAAVMGHSIGEYVAACVAGAIRLEDALKLVAERGRLMQTLPNSGKMAVVFASHESMSKSLESFAERVSIAAINGPENTVISGDGECVCEILSKLEQQGIKSQLLAVSHAFHSPLMAPMLNDFERTAREISYSRMQIGFVSNLTGNLFQPTDVIDAQYWRRHVREPVQFTAGIETLHRQGCKIFVESGPNATLLSMARRCIPDNERFWLPSLRRGCDDWEQMLQSLGLLYVNGTEVDWPGLYQGCTPRPHRLTLPTYPFQRQRYWLEPIATPKNFGFTGRDKANVHPLLGSRIDPAHTPATHVWQNQLSLRELPYLNDHRVQGAAIVPATAYMEMAMAAAAEIFGTGPQVLTEIENKKMLILRPDTTVTVQVVLTQGAVDKTATFRVYSQPTDSDALEKPIEGWTLHANGKVALGQGSVPSQCSMQFDAGAIQARCSEEISGKTFYQKLNAKGNEWGPSFQGIERLWRGDGEALSLVHVPESLQEGFDSYQFHPAVADACGHVLTATISLDKSSHERGGAFVGGGIDEVRLHRRSRSKKLWAYARLRPTTDHRENILIGDVHVFDEAGALVSEALGARLWYLEHDQQQPTISENLDDWIYKLQWQVAEQPKQEPARPTAPNTWLIFADKSGVGRALATVFQRQGQECFLISSGDSYKQLNENTFCVRPDKPEELGQLLKIIADTKQADACGIVHLWSLDAAISEGSPGLEELRSAQNLTCGSVLCLVQGLMQIQWRKPPRLWMVTRGAQSVNEEPDPPAVAQAALWGLGRTIALEHSELWGGLIDLDRFSTDDDAAKLLLQAIEFPTREDQLALRGSQRYVARLVRERLTPGGWLPFQCRSDGSYLITGGLGGIGLAVARWLVEKGARQLILLGRTKIPRRIEWRSVDPHSRMARKIAALRELEALGANVHVASVDVGDEVQLHSFLKDYYAEEWPPIRGVMHAAGVMQYQSLIDQDVKAMQDILKPKVMGGWLLHRLLKDEPLDFYVMFSSTSALLSSPLMGGYAAANAFLDALAHYRRALGQPALSVNWGTWAEVGMAVEFDRSGRQIELRGVGTIPTRQGLEALERFLQQGWTQAAVMPMYWRQWQESYPGFAQSPLFTDIFRENGSSRDFGRSTLTRESLHAVPAEDRRALLEKYLTDQVAAVLGMSAAALDLERPVSSFGFDSLMAIELKNRVEADLGIVIPIVQFLQGPSIAQLTELLLHQLEAPAAAVSSSWATNGDARQIGDDQVSLGESSGAPKDGAWEEGEI